MSKQLKCSILMALVWLTVACQSSFAQRLAFDGLSVSQASLQVAPAEQTCTAVCFLGCECPMAANYASKLNELSQKFEALRVVGVFSNVQDSIEDIRQFSRAHEIAFEVVVDSDGKVADLYGAKRTPEVFLVDSEFILRYHGRIDDQYAPGVARSKATREDLKLAVEQLLAGRAVKIKETKALGCIIGRPKAASPEDQPAVDGVNFADHIYPMLRKNCIECHRAGDIGPFAMTDYDEVVGWSDTMLEVIENGRMPPWHAEKGIGKFRNERFLTRTEKKQFRTWVESGAPKGGNVPELNNASSPNTWTLKTEPDSIFPMRNRPYRVPRDGVVEYQYFVVDPGFQEDKWITQAQVLPGNRSVVHHALVFVRPPDESLTQGISWIAAYVPGQRPQELPDGYARRIPAGSKFVFQMHYTPVGSAQDDLSHLGMTFTDAATVTHEVRNIPSLNQEFEIPPGESRFVVDEELTRFPRNGILLSLTPHMHYRGKSFLVRSQNKQSDSPTRKLLSVPNYDFNWQHIYELREPIKLKNLSSLRFTATFDNSETNPFNPDDKQWVMWGDQTWEEMALVFYDVAVPINESFASNKANAASQPSVQAAEAFADEFLKRCDRNRDGVISRNEGGIFLRRLNFGYWDANSDDVISRDEIVKAYREKAF